MSDTFPVRCPSCGGKFNLTAAHLGRNLRCGQCGHTFTATREDAPVPAPPPDHGLPSDKDTKSPTYRVSGHNRPAAPPPKQAEVPTGPYEPKVEDSAPPVVPPRRKSRRDEDDQDDDDRPRRRPGTRPKKKPTGTRTAARVGLFAGLAMGLLVLVGGGYGLYVAARSVKLPPGLAKNLADPRPEPPPPQPVPFPAPVIPNPNVPVAPAPLPDRVPNPGPVVVVPDRPKPQPKVKPGVHPKPDDAPAGKRALRFPPVTPVALTPAPLKQPRTEYGLPGVVRDAVAAGGGRYLLLLLPEEKKLAAFDACAAKVVKILDLADGDARIAGGMNQFVVAYPGTHTLVRYNLDTFQKDGEAKFPFAGLVKTVTMGAASAGPLLVVAATGTGALDRVSTVFLDLPTFQEIDLGKVEGRWDNYRSFRDNSHYRASADGRLFGMWFSSHSPSGLTSVVLGPAGNKAAYEHNSVGHVVPGPDGAALFTGAGQFAPDLRPAGGKAKGPVLPAQHGVCFLGLPGRDAKGDATARVFVPNEPRPVATVPDFGLSAAGEEWHKDDFTFDKRVLFAPDAKLIAVLAADDKTLVLHQFDLDAALEKAGFDYLLVTSRPPAAVPGKAFDYPIRVKAKAGKPAFELSSGPPGMKIDADGRLTWTVPGVPGEPAEVVVTVTAGDRTALHAFTLTPEYPSGAAAAPRAGGGPKLAGSGRAGLVRPPATVIPVTPFTGGAGGEVKLPAAADRACLGGGGRYAFFRLPGDRKLAAFDVSAGKVAKYLPLPEEDAAFAAGMDKLFVVAPGTNVLQRWDLATLTREKTVPAPAPVAANGNPAKPWGRAAMGHASGGPLVLATAGDDWNGRGIFVDPDALREIPGVKIDGRAEWRGPTLRASADGRVFGVGGGTLVCGGPRSATGHGNFGGGGDAVPGPDGTVFTATGLFTAEMKPKAGRLPGYAYLPAADGPFYLAVAAERGTVTVWLAGEAKRVADLFEVPGLAGKSALPLADRLFLVPAAKALVVLSAGGETLHVVPFDPKAALDKAGIDYLFVANRPPAAARGKKFTFAPEVWAKAGPAKVSLEAGPAGMKVEGGAVVWDVPADFDGDEQSVILTVADAAGKEAFHTAKVAVK